MMFLLRRSVARFIDYLLWGMLTVLILGDKAGDLMAPSYLFYASFWIYMIVEALLVSIFGTTFGKRLLGVYIFSQNEEKLSFFNSLKRSFLFFGICMGFFLPYVSLLSPLIAFAWWLKKKNFPWDTLVPDVVISINTTLLDKVVLTGFVLFMASGYFMTMKTALLYAGTDFDALESELLQPYFEDIRPQLVKALSEESVLSVSAARETMAALSSVQQQMQKRREEIVLVKEALQKRIDKMPNVEWRHIHQDKLNDFFNKTDLFLFAESMRIGLFENLIDFFTSEEKNKYVMIDGSPVFEDEEMMRQYDNYMTQLQTFLSLGVSEDN